MPLDLSNPDFRSDLARLLEEFLESKTHSSASRPDSSSYSTIAASTTTRPAPPSQRRPESAAIPPTQQLDHDIWEGQEPHHQPSLPSGPSTSSSQRGLSQPRSPASSLPSLPSGRSSSGSQHAHSVRRSATSRPASFDGCCVSLSSHPPSRLPTPEIHPTSGQSPKSTNVRLEESPTHFVHDWKKYDFHTGGAYIGLYGPLPFQFRGLSCFIARSFGPAA